MTNIINVLMNVFEHEANQARVVLAVTEPKFMKYTPQKGMRNLLDLANHLAQIPLLDPALYTRELPTREQANAKEKELWQDNREGLLSTFDTGIKKLKTRFSAMKEEVFFANTLQPFYETGAQRNWAFYLPELITHIAMHKMQLWMYLKLAGAHVNMMTYYGHAPE